MRLSKRQIRTLLTALYMGRDYETDVIHAYKDVPNSYEGKKYAIKIAKTNIKEFEKLNKKLREHLEEM